ncbi:sensor domain-containing diguanylate cyclase [Dyella telluris]|uniref:diguanylate cyclase n=1 Tax=Dyella telluris TaxID=2763498 RepID=A0A7G8Q5T1_9GAMM|nr:diguanylate cyclase [Dyella telluris]QNK02139.1 diguanylate cyclase [Dyella telluris]
MIKDQLGLALGSSRTRERMSWLKWTLPVLVALACSNIGVRVWQSWKERADVEALAANRVSVLATLSASIVQSHISSIDAAFSLTTGAIGSQTVSDDTLGKITQSLNPLLRDFVVSVYGNDDRLMATSRRLQHVDAPTIASLLESAGKQPSVTHVIVLPGDGEGVLYFAKAHLDGAGRHDVTTIVTLRMTQSLFVGMNLATHTMAILHVGDQVIARIPPLPGMPIASFVPLGQERRHASVLGTYYSTLPLDGQERLFAQRDILLDSGRQHWRLDVGYAVDTYRSAWRRGFYLNLGAMVIVAALLLGGYFMLRRERQIRSERAAWTRITNMILENMPMPVLVVAAGDGAIILANDASLGLFGAMASPGQPFPNLFTVVSAWEAIHDSDVSETTSMQTRNGPVDMLMRCREIDSPGNLGSMLLVTLTDISEQAQQMRQLQTAADLDPLTELPNRRYFDNAAERLTTMAREQPSSLAVIELDLDHFKRVNDSYGHAAGDRVLGVVAKLIRGAAREADVAARIGGEEFAMLLPDTSLEQAETVANRLRRSVEGTPILLEDGTTIVQTISMGVSVYLSREPGIDAALARADAALYEAKASGRNRVVVAPADVASAAD